MNFNIFEFCTNLLKTLFDFADSFLTVWRSTLPDLVANTSLGDIPVVGDVLSWITNISVLQNVTVAGLCFGSIALVVLITLVKWLISLIP